MKKLFFSLLFFTSLNSQAQDYYHAIGAAYNAHLYQLDYSSVSNGGEEFTYLQGAGLIQYKATLGFELSRSTNLGVSAYPGVGGYFSSRYGGYLAYQLPILAEFYAGDIDDACFNVGAGFYVGGVTGGGLILGPQVSIGGQFELAGQLVGIRGYYTYGVNKFKNLPSDAEVDKNSRMMFGIGLHYVFGY